MKDFINDERYKLNKHLVESAVSLKLAFKSIDDKISKLEERVERLETILAAILKK